MPGYAVVVQASLLFQWNGDRDPTHHIIELKVPFWAEQVPVVAVDTGL